MANIVRVTDKDNDNHARVEGSSDVYVNNLQVVRVDDKDDNDDICTEGSPSVFINNKAAARTGDKDSNDNTVINGSPSVFIDTSSSSIFKTPAEPAIVLSPAQQATYANNVANVGKYNTSNNIANGVGGHPEMEDDGPVEPTSAVVANPDCTGGGDMGAALDNVLGEAANGQWRETGNNPNISQLYKDVGFPGIRGDSTAWCAAFTGSMLKSNCFKFTKSLAAASYTGYGNPVDGGISNAKKGDVVVFNRDGGTGHVAFYYGPGPNSDTIVVVGGNQHDNVTKSIRHISELKLNGVQRPIPA